MQLLKEFQIILTDEPQAAAVRAVLKDLGYPLSLAFSRAELGEIREKSYYDAVKRLESVSTVGRMVSVNPALPTYTLEEFIQAHIAPPKTPAQIELEKLEAQADELNKQIAALRTAINQ